MESSRTDIIRVGIIGAHVGGVRSAGSWGVRAHIPALQALPEFKITAVATSSDTTANETGDLFDIPYRFSDPAALASHSEVDVVAVCVRVPEHRALVMTALDAGKHVYCEWPLGRDTAEATFLADAARSAGVTHMIGLQGRHSPALNFVADLLRQSEIGDVRACALNHSVPWPRTAAPSSAYLQTRASGANYLSIPGGHSIDMIANVVGAFEQLAALTKVQVPEFTISGAAAVAPRDTPDQIVIAGELAGGAVAALRFQGASGHGAGISLEINGASGDLLVTPISSAASMMQIWDLKVQRTTALGAYEDLPIPERYFDIPASIRTGPPMNVARSYRELGAAIREGRSASPDFEDAVCLHRTLDTIESASRERRWVDCAA